MASQSIPPHALRAMCTHTHSHTQHRSTLPKSSTFPRGALNNISVCPLSVSSSTQFSHDPFMNTSSCKAFFSTWGYFCSIMHGGGIKTVDAMQPPLPFFVVTCRHKVANGVRVRHATGQPAWPPTHLGEWGVCVRSTVSNGEHLWPLGCGDRGQWWPRGSRRALDRAAKG